MLDPYCPFMGRKGKAWGELDLPSIAERVAGIPPEVEAAARALSKACKKSGVGLERAQEVLKTLFEDLPVSASASRRGRR
jgi:hypothetical protein